MKRAIALGTFDGVHIGHRAIINAAIDKAAELDMEPMIYTFTAHPMALFGKQPPLLMTQSERMAALGGMGCTLSADEFSAEYAATEPEQFIKMLIERLDMGCAVAGFNYTFGRRGDGSVELIKKLGEKYGFAVEIVPPVMYKGEAVSSTRIRACLEGRGGDAGRAVFDNGAYNTQPRHRAHA